MNSVLKNSPALGLPLRELDGVSFMSRDGRGYLSTVTGASWRTGGRYFDGVDDMINLGNPDSLNFHQQDFTIEAWVKADSLEVSTPRVILSKWYDNTHRQVSFYIRGSGMSNPRRLEMETGGGASDGGVYNAMQLSVGVEYHVAAVYIDGVVPVIRLYVNGNIQGVTGTPVRLGATTSSWNIGRRGDGTGFFHGLIRELRMYARALTAQEIQDSYMVEKGR